MIQELINRAIEAGRVVRFRYEGTANGLSYRVLSPYEVRGPNVLGYDHERDALRQFALSGIRSLVLTDEPYIAPEEATT